ncbi:TBC1 domain family member 10A [Schistosoma japonicum]|uniref:TBC1 domain family member 10A n=1 Tax=Schistosoma japonicum TaxID=6182 RepID=A0A4Z2DWV8_SCHJA|nr:TBC1 domain family member 10A [Schistosoma japonicum]TNN20996.1 TBC1 domain family member 10A [Schistosoma japonicum]
MDNIVNAHENSPRLSEDDSLQCDRYGFRGGQQYTDPDEEDRVPIEVIRSRELKWRKMCSNWSLWYFKYHQKLRDRCRKGIPDSFRCEAWQRLCASPMVLVQRQRITYDETGGTETALAIIGTNQNVNHDSKSKFPKHRFATLSNRANYKSLQAIITSPSFHASQGKEDDRRKLLFRKLHGTENSRLSQGSSFHSLHINRIKDAPNASHDNYRYPSALPLSLQYSDSPNTHRISPWQRSLYNNESIRSISSTTHSSLHNLPSIALNNVSSSMFNQSALPHSGYSTIASVHGKSYSPKSHIDTDDIILPNHVVATSTTRNSGGYASLSTTDSSSTNHFQNEIQIHETSSTDSCTSILISSSVASSSSPILNRITRNIANLSLSSQPSDTVTEYDNDDARATLVPPVDLDPEKLYTNYCLQEGTPANCDQIRRDIDRQFPFHELFSKKGGHGQESLYTLLKAYTIRHPEKGYCQGQAPLAAVLLMFMPEVDAFWTFNEICERYLESYYDDGLERVQIDGNVLYALLKSIHPPIYKFLRKYSVEPNLVVLEWFMCAYTRTLPWSAVLRIWDMFFCDGKIILFKVAIVLINRLFGNPSHRKSCTGLDDILTRLREVSSVVGKLDNFIREVVRVPITAKELSQQIVRQSQKWTAKVQK